MPQPYFIRRIKKPLQQSINWTQINTVAIAVIIPVIGWIVQSNLTAERDKGNKIREIRIDFLRNSYLKLANAVARDTNSYQYHRDIEAVFSEIQLFGNKPEADLVREEIKRNMKPGLMKIECDSILKTMRNSLRKELNQDTTNVEILPLRFSELISNK